MLRLAERADTAAFERKLKNNAYMRLLHEAGEGIAYIGEKCAVIHRGGTLYSTSADKEVAAYAALIGAAVLVPARAGLVFARRECDGESVFVPPKFEDVKKLFSILEECGENDQMSFDEFYTASFADFSKGKRHIEADDYSCAMTLFETSRAAYIVGVCTRPEHRRKGYALGVLERLCTKLGGKTAYVLYDKKYSPLYEKAGFEKVQCYKFVDSRGK